MAVSVTDPAYRAEIVPVSFDALGNLLCAHWGVGPTAFGDRGNLQHTNGYHRSRRYNQLHAPSNYSIQLAADKGGNPDWISAFDFTPAEWGSAANRTQMVIITKRMRAAARAHDPRVSSLREFAGTEDGRNVVTIDMQTGADRAPFDSSHLDHGHGSVFRSLAANDHTGIYEVMAGLRGAAGGDDMDNNQAQQLTNVHEWLLNFLQGNVTGTWPHSNLALPKLVPNEKLNALTAQVTVLSATVKALADAINAGGGNVDTAVILARVDKAVANLTAETRDAVADLGEGGSAQVRADAV